MNRLVVILALLFIVGSTIAQEQRSKQTIAVIVGDTQSFHAETLTKILKSKGFKYRLYSLKQLSTIPYHEIFDEFLSSAVVRLVDHTDSSSFMSLEETEFWVEFLSNRGSLTLFADRLSDQQQVFDSDLNDYVGFKVRKATSQIESIIGAKQDLIAKGTNFKLTQSNRRDQIIPHAESGIDVVHHSEDGAIVGIKHQTCNYKFSYFSFLPAEIKSADVRDKFVERTVDWNLGYSISLGMNAPDFNIRLSDGTPTGIYNEYNKLKSVVVLEFMATWCSSCKKQLPRMVQLHDEFKNSEVSFIFVDYKEKLSVVKNYLKSHPEIVWPVTITPDGLGALRYGVKSLPGIFILDHERKIRFIHQGNLSISTLRTKIVEILQTSTFKKVFE